MDDLAVVTGGTVVDKELGGSLAETTLDQLGSARRNGWSVSVVPASPVLSGVR
jgi:chaperonin GroEL (HSP60 family)